MLLGQSRLALASLLAFAAPAFGQVQASGVTLGGISIDDGGAGAITHSGILPSTILYFDFETDVDPQPNRGTKGSPTGCDAAESGSLAHNTSSPLQGTGDMDFTGGFYEISTTAGNCGPEIRIGGDFCTGWILKRNSLANHRIVLNWDGGSPADGHACHVRNVDSCGTDPSEAEKCFRCYTEEATNGSTDVEINVDTTYFLGASYSDTTGEYAMFVDGADATVDIGTATTPRAVPNQGGTHDIGGGGAPNFDGHLDGYYFTDVQCAPADFCYICSCGIDNEEGCTYTGASWTDKGRNSSCDSCTLPTGPSTYTGPS